MHNPGEAINFGHHICWMQWLPENVQEPASRAEIPAA
jgi:hypothetical protein